MLRSYRAAMICLLLATAGCAAPASQYAMTVQRSSTAAAVANPAYAGQMTVRTVTGGEETSPLWKSRVDNASFKAALQSSLSNAGYGAANAGAAKYFVDATLQSIDQPSIGFTFDISSTVLYTVEGPAGKKTYPITATGSASTSDALSATQRLKIANEHSILENIKAFLAALSKDTK